MRILILAQHIHPMQTPRAHRATELSLELARQGHQVVIYSVIGKHDYAGMEKEFGLTIKPIEIKWMIHPYNSDNDGRRTIPDKVLGKLLKKLEFPNLEFYFRVQEILAKDNKYDALISIADPHQIHWGIAKYRSKHPELFPKVWIADCGDPFMLNGVKSGHLTYFERYERLFCQNSDIITVPVENAKQGYYEEYRSKIRVIAQGFKFEEESNAGEPTNPVPTFAYAGTFYKDIRNPEKLFDYLTGLQRDFRFIIYSNHTELIDRFKAVLGDKLNIRKPIPRRELLKELKTMDFLLNLENENSPAQIPSKLIDYAITGRPILSINPGNPDIEKVNQFLSKIYLNQYLVKDLDQYRIENIANRFIEEIKWISENNPDNSDICI
ncbi:MAG: hypothetical protein LW688_03705 [Cryomorphaceae bacterium]|jgi:hypothetical protein|nr:hypothetical protein [Cryomorphaceae bacterium]